MWKSFKTQNKQYTNHTQTLQNRTENKRTSYTKHSKMMKSNTIYKLRTSCTNHTKQYTNHTQTIYKPYTKTTYKHCNTMQKPYNNNTKTIHKPHKSRFTNCGHQTKHTQTVQQLDANHTQTI